MAGKRAQPSRDCWNDPGRTSTSSSPGRVCGREYTLFLAGELESLRAPTLHEALEQVCTDAKWSWSWTFANSRSSTRPAYKQ